MTHQICRQMLINYIHRKSVGILKDWKYDYAFSYRVLLISSSSRLLIFHPNR